MRYLIFVRISHTALHVDAHKRRVTQKVGVPMAGSHPPDVIASQYSMKSNCQQGGPKRGRRENIQEDEDTVALTRSGLPGCWNSGRIVFNRVALLGLASSAFPRHRQCRAFPMPLDISGHKAEFEVPATNNSAASGVGCQVVDIRQEGVETVAPAWIDMVVGRKHASILFPKELVLMSFWHGAQMGMLGCGSNSERAV